MTKPKTPNGRVEFITQAREHLEKVRAALINDLAAEIRSAHSDANGGSMDSADLASKELEQTMTVKLSARERGRIIEIDYALGRMEDGTYGVCEACGFEINDQRLEAMPFTRHCRDCQYELERAAKGRYHGSDIDRERFEELGSKFGGEELNPEPTRKPGNEKRT